MLSVWWDWKGVEYFELLPRNQTINSDVYCQQLDKLKFYERGILNLAGRWQKVIEQNGNYIFILRFIKNACTFF